MEQAKKKEKKGQRFHLRVRHTLKEKAAGYAGALSVSLSQFIENALKSYMNDPNKIIYCPTCKKPIVELERQIKLARPEGISSIKCIEGHEHWYDWDDLKFVK